MTSTFVDFGLLFSSFSNTDLANHCHGHLSPYVARDPVKRAGEGLVLGWARCLLISKVCLLVVTLAPLSSP